MKSQEETQGSSNEIDTRRSVIMRFMTPVILAVAAAASMFGAFILHPGHSEAASLTNISGRPGDWSFPQLMGTSGTGGLYARLDAVKYSAWRSTAYPSSTQVICSELRVWRRQSPGQAWTYVISNPQCVTTVPGQYVQFGEFSRNVTPYFSYTADLVFTWKLANGAVIGQVTVAYTGTGDYRCMTRSCNVAANGGRAEMWLEG